MPPRQPARIRLEREAAAAAGGVAAAPAVAAATAGGPVAVVPLVAPAEALVPAVGPAAMPHYVISQADAANRDANSITAAAAWWVGSNPAPTLHPAVKAFIGQPLNLNAVMRINGKYQDGLSVYETYLAVEAGTVPPAFRAVERWHLRMVRHQVADWTMLALSRSPRLYDACMSTEVFQDALRNGPPEPGALTPEMRAAILRQANSGYFRNLQKPDTERCAVWFEEQQAPAPMFPRSRAYERAAKPQREPSGVIKKEAKKEPATPPKLSQTRGVCSHCYTAHRSSSVQRSHTTAQCRFQKDK
jgi:hypothetical protein